MESFSERNRRTFDILEARHGDISDVECPSEFDNMSYMQAMLHCFENKYVARVPDGFEWNPDFEGYEVFKDFVELYSAEMAGFLEELK